MALTALQTSALASVIASVHNTAQTSGWWNDVNTGEPIPDGKVWEDVVPKKLLLIHSEISEACEGHRKALPDDKLPNRSMFEVELADAVIRIFDLAGRLGLPLAEIIAEKDLFNSTRPDHKIAARAQEGGKTY